MKDAIVGRSKLDLRAGGNVMINTNDLGPAGKSLSQDERAISPLRMVSIFSSLGALLVCISLLLFGFDRFAEVLAAMAG
jgi:hypothetical protein